MSFKQPNLKSSFLAVAFLGLALLAAVAWADVLDLTNGDHYSGAVVSMTPTNIEFRSEIQGIVNIPRDKVAKITLRESVAPKPVAAITGTNQLPAPSALAAALAATNQSPPTPQQIRQGVDPKTVAQIQEQILGKSSPEATQKFNQMLAGLMSGSLKVDDIRAQAQKSINDIQDAKKELGGDAGDMLDGYLKILQDFVNETESPANRQPATK